MNRSGRQNSSAIGRRDHGGGCSEGADCQVLASSSMWCASGLSLNCNTGLERELPESFLARVSVIPSEETIDFCKNRWENIQEACFNWLWA